MAAAKTTPTKRVSGGNAGEDPFHHDTVPAGATLPLHPLVLEALQCQDQRAQLRRVHTKGDGSCMLNSVLMSMANGVHPTTDQAHALRDRLKRRIEEMTQDAWDSLENDGQCSTPQEYAQRFLSQPDAFLDRSILHFVLQLNNQDVHPAHQLPSAIYCITIQPLFPDADVEESDDISVNVFDKADMAVRVHKFGKSSGPGTSSADCIVLYQLWGSTVSKHVELVVDPSTEPALTRFSHDHPFIVALDKCVSSKIEHIEYARQHSFVCTPLQGWTFPCFLDVDFHPTISSSSSSQADSSIVYSKLPVAQRMLTSVRRDLDRSDRRFLKYIVALSHISQMSNEDKREEEYSKLALFLDKYEPCNMPIILGCILIGFFIYATPQVSKWFHSQKRVTLKMLASCPAALVRDEYLLRRRFLHLMKSNTTLIKRDVITALAVTLIAEDCFLVKGGWDIDVESNEFTFLVMHTTGEAEDNDRVLNHERVWWPQSLLQQDVHWATKVESKGKALRSLTIKDLGEGVRHGMDGEEELCVCFTGDPQNPLWWTRDQILHQNVKQWKEKLGEYEAQRTAEEDDEKNQDEEEAANKDKVIRELRAEIAREKAALEKERVRREKAEQALKERVEKEREKIKAAKEALAAERAEIARTRDQLAKQEAKIKDWIRDHPEAAEVVVNDS